MPKSFVKKCRDCLQAAFDQEEGLEETPKGELQAAGFLRQVLVQSGTVVR